MSDKIKLPPLQDEAFDGYKEKAEIPAKGSFVSKCNHSAITFNAQRREIRCQCGAAWNGVNIGRLYQAMKNR